MPFYKSISYCAKSTSYFWKIEESYDFLFSAVSLKKQSLQRLHSMRSESHKKGFLAVRMLLQHLGYSDFDLFYDTSGKPYLKDGKEISISHSFSFSVISIGTKKVGIDLEILKPKVLRIASRYMDISHLENLNDNEKIKKAIIIWGVKEAIFKIKNEKKISFPNHISEIPFSLNDTKGTAFLNFNNKIEKFDFYFDFIENYGFVCATQNYIASKNGIIID